METFNLSQSYPTQDIRKRTSFLTIGLSICLLAAGISLFFLPESTSESNINALKIAAGSLLAVISFYFLIFRLLMQKKPDIQQRTVPRLEKITWQIIVTCLPCQEKSRSCIC